MRFPDLQKIEIEYSAMTAEGETLRIKKIAELYESARLEREIFGSKDEIACMIEINAIKEIQEKYKKFLKVQKVIEKIQERYKEFLMKKN